MARPNCGNPLSLSPETAEAYHGSIVALQAAEVPHLIGGAYALAYHTGVVRPTKDFDLFIKPADRERALAALAKAGYATEIVFPFWLAKAFTGGRMVDLLYRSPNGNAEVTDAWLQRAHRCQVLGTPALVCAPEELLFTKLYVLNNDRNDLADVMHLLDSTLETMEWPQVLNLVGTHWRLLLAHLVMFGFVYPSERARIPKDYFGLLDRLDEEPTEEPGSGRVCNGTLLSHSMYLVDVAKRGFTDGRLRPDGRMTRMDLIDATISTDDPNRPKLVKAASGDR